MSFYLFGSWFAIVLQVLQSLYTLSQMLSEGQQVTLIDTFQCVLNIIAGNFLLWMLKMLLIDLSSIHLSHKFMNEFFILFFKTFRSQVQSILRFNFMMRFEQILVTLCLF